MPYSVARRRCKDLLAMDSAIGYGQNVAAITALFYEDGALSSHVQEVLEQKISGDVELWEILATGGLVFTQQEAAYTAKANVKSWMMY